MMFAGFFYETVNRVYIIDTLVGIDCNKILAYFIVCVASFIETSQSRSLNDIIIIVVMFRKLLNSEGYK